MLLYSQPKTTAVPTQDIEATIQQGMVHLKLRIVGISSSPRSANTEPLLKEALTAAKAKYSAVTELFFLQR